MNNHFEKHIRKAAEGVSLSDAEKSRMTHMVREYMAMKPLPMRASVVSIEWFSYSWVKQPLAAALALVFIFSGGISYAAESALPGDALYAVKTNVNEAVKVALATNTEAKANVQIELAERRIEEAATLASENRLDAETEGKLAAAFEAHAESATEEVATIDEEDSSAAAEISSRFETRLAAHEEVLSLVSANADATNTLSVAIRGKGRAVADLRARAEERIAVSAAPATTMSLTMQAAPAADTAMKAAAGGNAETETRIATTNPEKTYDARAAERMKVSAEAQLKAAKKKVKSSKLEGSAKAAAEAKLEEAEEYIADGRAFLKEKAAAHAYHSFQESLVLSERLSVLLKAETALKKASAQKAANAGKETARTQGKNSPETRTTVREAINASLEASATIDATVAPTTPNVETGASVAEEIIQVIPPPLKIFKFDDDEEQSENFINIDL